MALILPECRLPFRRGPDFPPLRGIGAHFARQLVDETVLEGYTAFVVGDLTYSSPKRIEGVIWAITYRRKWVRTKRCRDHKRDQRMFENVELFRERFAIW